VNFQKKSGKYLSKQSISITICLWENLFPSPRKDGRKRTVLGVEKAWIVRNQARKVGTSGLRTKNTEETSITKAISRKKKSREAGFLVLLGGQRKKKVWGVRETNNIWKVSTTRFTCRGLGAVGRPCMGYWESREKNSKRLLSERLKVSYP